MDTKETRFSSTSWMILGILAVVIALVTLIAVRHLRQERYEESDTSKLPPGSAERSKSFDESVPPSEQSAPSPDRTVKELVAAWNQGQGRDIAEMFVSDGVLILPAGSQIQSRAEIEKTIAEKGADILKDTTLSNTVDDVSQTDADSVTVKGTYQIEGIKVLGFAKSAKGSYVLHQVKRDGRWLISRAEFKKGSEG